MMAKDKKKEDLKDFTLSMAVMDCLPVVFFAVSVASIAARFASPAFLVGAVLVILAGGMKAAWKFVLALAHKDVPFLSKQMRVVMPAGFIVMVVGLIVDRAKWSPAWVLAAVTTAPSLYFLVIAVAGLIFMVSFAIHGNSRDARTNWREQIVNTVAQACLMICVLCA